MTESEADPLALAINILSDPNRFVRAVFSGRRRNMQPADDKVEVRPVQLGETLKLQMIAVVGTKSRTTNFEFNQFNFRELAESGYANLLVQSTTETLTMRFTKKGDVQLHRELQTSEQITSHDRQKSRLLNTESDFLEILGIADKFGNVKPSMNDKFLQIEEFLRVLMPMLEGEFENGRIIRPTVAEPLTIVDHGCGNAYLTLAVHSYLLSKSIPNKMIGIDRREDSRLRNTQTANDLGVSDSVSFTAAQILNAAVPRADLAIALHACDTATDEALAWAVTNSAKIVLVSPCCHNDLQTQIDTAPEPWGLVTKHGIMKQRLGDILTDTLRAQIMRLSGYRTDVIEFIGDEHTPRNLMIRAVFTGAPRDPQDLANYKNLLAQWSIRPKLADFLQF